VIIAIPDEATESNRFELKIPVLGSLIATGTTTSKEVGLTSFPPQDRPPVLIPFLTFRVMVGCGLIMLGLAWLGSWLIMRHRLERSRWLLWSIFLSFPLPFVATLAGWYTAEIGRQPWVVYGVLRTAKAMTPFLTAHAAATSLILFAVVYAFIFSFGIYYIYRLLRAGPGGSLAAGPAGAMPNRPMSLAGPDTNSNRHVIQAGE
jgi:cytochrome d ubiquinol oxidase subunit I